MCSGSVIKQGEAMSRREQQGESIPNELQPQSGWSVLINVIKERLGLADTSVTVEGVRRESPEERLARIQAASVVARERSNNLEKHLRTQPSLHNDWGVLDEVDRNLKAKRKAEIEAEEEADKRRKAALAVRGEVTWHRSFRRK